MYAYTEDLISFAEDVKINLPKISSVGGQALAFLSQPENRSGGKFITPQETADFFTKLGIKTRDSIQPFNKPWGNRLQLVDAKPGLYSLKYPFVLKWNDISKRISVDKNVLENGTKEEQIDEVKKYWFHKMTQKEKECEILLDYLRMKWSYEVYNKLLEELSNIQWVYTHILSMPHDRWQIGHLDASKGNESENLFYQPPIQARFRDNYIFNKYFERIKVKV
jgi:hypothetical protein